MEIYILIDNKPQGPYTPELVRQYLAAGRLSPTDLAAYAGRADWKPLSEMVRSWAQPSPGKGARSSPTAISPAESSKRKVVVAISVVALALLVGAASLVFWKFHGKRNWASTKVVTPAEPGWPNSYAEWNTWYLEPPEGQNAATFFVQGLNEFQISDADQKSVDLPVLGRGSLPLAGGPLAPQVKASIVAMVQRNDAAWAALKQGASFEQARYPIDLNRGSETLLPHLGKIKKAIQFGQLKAAMCADDNQSEEAAETLSVSLALAQSLKDEPILISQLVRVAGFAIEMSSVQYVLNSVSLSSVDLERLSAAFAKVESAEIAGQGFTRAFVGERVGTLTFFDLPPDRLEASLKEANVRPSQPVEELMHNIKTQRGFAEETFNHMLAMRKEPFPERLKVDEYFAARTSLAKDNKFYLCEMLLPGLERATKREAAGLANLRLAQTAIALERFRRANGGSLPDSLAALVPTFLPGVPADPFKGEPLFYHKNGDGYELRSTGQDPKRPLSIRIVRLPK